MRDKIFEFVRNPLQKLSKDDIMYSMITKIFPRLGDCTIIKYLKRGLESKYSAIPIAALILCSNLFSWEIPIMYTLVGLFAIAVLFADDMLCMMPFACGVYFLFSKQNNPLDGAHTSVFLSDAGKTHLWVISCILAVCILSRLIFDIVAHKERRKFPLLSVGFVALGISYVLGGLFTSYYKLDTVFFGLTQIISISISYFFFYYTVDFKKVKKSYFAFLMIVMGFLLCGETLGMLQSGGFFTTEGEFYRGNLYTGWGIYNNVAGAMIMCIPAPFYYATTKEKHSWFFLLIGNIFYITILFIQSRGGMVFGSCVYALCLLITFWKTKQRKSVVFSQVCIWISIGLICLFFQDKIADMFYSIIQSGMNDSGRFNIYENGLRQFLDAPIFGNGFYACTAFRWGDNMIGKFLPARYHNTIVQLVASGGMVALLAYGYHRFQTLRMIFKKRTVEKYFIGACVLGLLLTSLLDCHFFNFGPGLTYGSLLLLLEIEWKREPLQELAETSNQIPEVTLLEIPRRAACRLFGLFFLALSAAAVFLLPYGILPEGSNALYQAIQRISSLQWFEVSTDGLFVLVYNFAFYHLAAYAAICALLSLIVLLSGKRTPVLWSAFLITFGAFVYTGAYTLALYDTTDEIGIELISLALSVVALLASVLCAYLTKPLVKIIEPEKEEEEQEPIGEFYVEEYVSGAPCNDGPVVKMFLAKHITPTVPAPISPPSATAQELVDAPKAHDPFIATLETREIQEFVEIFILKTKAPLAALPAYAVGEENKTFFRKFFIHLSEYRHFVPDELLQKMYEYSLTIQ